MAKPVYAEVRARDGRCRACLGIMKLEVHHIIFRSQGGGDESDNLITLCKQCHGRAHNIEPDYIAPWELQAIVWNEFGGAISNFRQVMRVSARGFPTCTTCDLRSETWECLPHEHPVDNSFTCPDWRERDAGTLKSQRIHPKSLRA